MAVLEPTLEQFPHPASKYLAATRPPFLIASVIPCLIGISFAISQQAQFTLWTASLTIVGAVLAHASVNVFNDYYDSLSGTDDINVDRLFPFTGGARFIQNGVLSRKATFVWAAVLALLATVVALILFSTGGWTLVALAAMAALLGWGYSAPPLALNSRGWGELTVALGFGPMMVSGAYLVQTGTLSLNAVLVGVPYGLLAAALLYINQFPDVNADARTGKHHWVVRLTPSVARWGYVAIILCAYLLHFGYIVAGILPLWSAVGLVALPLSAGAALELVRYAELPPQLTRAIKSTILAKVAYGLVLSISLLMLG